MNKLVQVLGTLLLLACIVFPAQAQSEKAVEPPYIEVIGQAEKEVTPDEIWVSITLRERMDGREKITVAKQEEELLTALKTIGISQEQLSLSAANARFAKIGWSRREVMAKTEYLLLLSTAEQVARVYEKLDELKISEAHINRVSHSKIEEFKQEVRIMAIKAAKGKADYMLNAIGQQTGKAMVVTEVSAPAPPMGEYSNYSNVVLEHQEKIGFAGDKGTIAFKKIKIEASVYAKFEIL